MKSVMFDSARATGARYEISIYLYIYIYLHLTGNTPGGPKWGPKGAPVNRLPEVTGGGGESEKTIGFITNLGLLGQVQMGAAPLHFGEIGGGGFGVVFGTILGHFRTGFLG